VLSNLGLDSYDSVTTEKKHAKSKVKVVASTGTLCHTGVALVSLLMTQYIISTIR
jgi:hypothetical protein